MKVMAKFRSVRRCGLLPVALNPQSCALSTELEADDGLVVRGNEQALPCDARSRGMVHLGGDATPSTNGALRRTRLLINLFKKSGGHSYQEHPPLTMRLIVPSRV